MAVEGEGLLRASRHPSTWRNAAVHIQPGNNNSFPRLRSSLLLSSFRGLLGLFLDSSPALLQDCLGLLCNCFRFGAITAVEVALPSAHRMNYRVIAPTVLSIQVRTSNEDGRPAAAVGKIRKRLRVTKVPPPCNETWSEKCSRSHTYTITATGSTKRISCFFRSMDKPDTPGAAGTQTCLSCRLSARRSRTYQIRLCGAQHFHSAHTCTASMNMTLPVFPVLSPVSLASNFCRILAGFERWGVSYWVSVYRPDVLVLDCFGKYLCGIGPRPC